MTGSGWGAIRVGGGRAAPSSSMGPCEAHSVRRPRGVSYGHAVVAGVLAHLSPAAAWAASRPGLKQDERNTPLVGLASSRLTSSVVFACCIPATLAGVTDGAHACGIWGGCECTGRFFGSVASSLGTMSMVVSGAGSRADAEGRLGRKQKEEVSKYGSSAVPYSPLSLSLCCRRAAAVAVGAAVACSGSVLCALCVRACGRRAGAHAGCWDAGLPTAALRRGACACGHTRSRRASANVLYNIYTPALRIRTLLRIYLTARL
jgi:hypothetical protein